MPSSTYTEYPVGLPWYQLLRNFEGGGCDHFYTSSVAEGNHAETVDGYQYQLRAASQWGAAGWLLPNGSGQTPLYRALASWSHGGVARQDHFYTIDRSEIVAPYVEEGGGPIGEVWVGSAAQVPAHAFPMYRGVRSFPNTGGSMDHFYSTQPSEFAGNGYTIENGGEVYFWVLPARSAFLVSDDGTSIVAGPRFTSGDGITYEDGDIEMVNDQTAAWVRPRGISTWTFNRLQFENENGQVIPTPSMMTLTTESSMIRLEDKDVANTDTTRYHFSVWTNLAHGVCRLDPQVVNKPTAGPVIHGDT